MDIVIKRKNSFIERRDGQVIIKAPYLRVMFWDDAGRGLPGVSDQKEVSNGSYGYVLSAGEKVNAVRFYMPSCKIFLIEPRFVEPREDGFVFTNSFGMPGNVFVPFEMEGVPVSIEPVPMVPKKVEFGQLIGCKNYNDLDKLVREPVEGGKWEVPSKIAGFHHWIGNLTNFQKEGQLSLI